MLKVGTRYPVQKVHYFAKQRKSQDVISIRCLLMRRPGVHILRASCLHSAQTYGIDAARTGFGWLSAKHLCGPLDCSVVEGETRRMEEDTPMVGQFMVSGLRLLPQAVNVTLAINDSGILEVLPRMVF